MFVSLFNFQGPLPLKERAFCILPHHRRFVNTLFFCLSGLFYPRTASSCWHSFSRPRSSCALCTPFRFPSRRVLDHSIKPLPFCQYLFPTFSPSLYNPYRALRERHGTRILHAKRRRKKNSYEENFDIPFVFKPLSAPINENQVKQRGALFFILIIVYPSIMSLI